MSKYDALGSYLAVQAATHIPMSFDEIEKVIGRPLPPVADSARAWWSNNPSNNVMTKVWLAAGFKTEQVDMAARRLVFRRDRPGDSMPVPPPTLDRFSMFGCLKGTIRIDVDLDLTEPAGANWDEDGK